MGCEHSVIFLSIGVNNLISEEIGLFFSPIQKMSTVYYVMEKDKRDINTMGIIKILGLFNFLTSNNPQDINKISNINNLASVYPIAQ